MERIRKFFERDLYAKHSGIVLTDVGKGTARARMAIQKHHLNGVGTVQGGAIFTLADLAFAAACNSHGTVAVAVQVNIAFVKAVSEGTLYAEAKETFLGPKLCNYDIHVTDEKGDLVALFHGLAYRKKETLEEIQAKG